MLTFLCILLVLHIVSHIFLVRFFLWRKKESVMNKLWVKWVLFVPPIALVITLLLVILGLGLRVVAIFSKKVRDEIAYSRSNRQ